MSEKMEDPTGWMLDTEISKFMLLSTAEIGYMAMLAYTFLHGTSEDIVEFTTDADVDYVSYTYCVFLGCNLFPTLPKDASGAYKFVAMCFQCTGGGILVPLLINAIPVTLGKDAYPICIFISFLVHQYFPLIRDIVKLSPIFKAALIVLYECQRASVVFKLCTAAAAQIQASDFLFAVFGPIFCGGIGGCGGAFLPMSKGLDPIKNGLAQPMYTALTAAACLHLFLSTSLSDGVEKAEKKAQLCMAVYFILAKFYDAFPSMLPRIKFQWGEDNAKVKTQ